MRQQEEVPDIQDDFPHNLFDYFRLSDNESSKRTLSGRCGGSPVTPMCGWLESEACSLGMELLFPSLTREFEHLNAAGEPSHQRQGSRPRISVPDRHQRLFHLLGPIRRLRNFLVEVSSRTGATSITVIAHSMGNQILLSALSEPVHAEHNVPYRQFDSCSALLASSRAPYIYLIDVAAVCGARDKEIVTCELQALWLSNSRYISD